MSVFLVGGGPDTTTAPGLLDPFRAELAARARDRTPRLAVALVDQQGSAHHFLPQYVRKLVDTGPADIELVCVRPGRTVAPDAFVDVDGIAVGGGPTPEYLAGLTGAGHAVQAAVTAGVPYVGFSAGAMIAPSRALIGGCQVGGAVVCPREWSEGLSTLVVHSGLGLVQFTVDVHTAQAGTLGRTVAVVESGAAAVAVGIDENTCLAVRAGEAPPEEGTVLGIGNVWVVRPSGVGRSAVVTRIPGPGS